MNENKLLKFSKLNHIFFMDYVLYYTKKKIKHRFLSDAFQILSLSRMKQISVRFRNKYAILTH